MADKEPVRWITVKGKHLPIYEDGSIGVGQEEEPKEKNNTAWDKAVAKIEIAKEVWHIDREEYAVGLTKTGDIFVGHGGLDSDFRKDTPENRKWAESVWKANSFTREIKKKK